MYIFASSGQISLALAGFAPDEISSRPFKRQFNLADYVQVKGAAFDMSSLLAFWLLGWAVGATGAGAEPLA
jgi:hypothetical protein